MKRLLALGLTLAAVLTAAALSRSQRPPASANGLHIEKEGRNPWTHLRLNDDPDHFHFAVVSDRTGGHRAKVFSQAVERLNLLQPAFVLSVGDLIEGYSDDKDKLADQWKEFDRYVGRLEMPFFYVPGNHDVSNATMSKVWGDKLGRSYYHFLYRNVLFLLLSSEDPTASAGGQLRDAQIAYARKVLADNPKVRWTVVAVHRPLWAQKNLARNGWLAVEGALAGRRYTVFTGHLHRFQKYVRNGMNYYQLATTGGGSKLRGVRYGEFDQIAWVTMKKDGPVVANLLLDGVYLEDLTVPRSDEPAAPPKTRKKTHPAAGKVLYEGEWVPNAVVVLYSYNARTRRYTRVADALCDSGGSFALSTYEAFDGVPEGDYKVTVTRHEPRFDEAGRPARNLLPGRYADPKTTPLRMTVREGSNRAELRLDKSPE